MFVSNTVPAVGDGTSAHNSNGFSREPQSCPDEDSLQLVLLKLSSLDCSHLPSMSLAVMRQTQPSHSLHKAGNKLETNWVSEHPVISRNHC